MPCNVGHAAFTRISADGHDFRIADKGVVPPKPDDSARQVLPQRRRNPQPVKAPKIAARRRRALFADDDAIVSKNVVWCGVDCAAGGAA